MPVKLSKLALSALLLISPAWAQVGSGQSAPPFRACDRLGNQVELQHFQGRPLVLAFMAFWCDTWKPMLSDLKRLNGAQVLLVAVDSRERALTEPAMLLAQLPFPLVIDVGREIGEKYGVTTVPTIVVIDADGVVRNLHQGYPGNALLGRELADCSGPPPRQEATDPSYLIPEERVFLRAFQAERSKRGLPPVRLEAALTDVARERLQRMLERGQLSHGNPETPDVRLRKRGFSFHKVAENLAEAPHSERAIQEMLKSPSHKANLLHSAYRQVGVAALRCGPQGFIYALLLTD